MTLIVCPLSHVHRIVEARAPSHLITLLDPASLIDTPQGFQPERHLRLGVNDIVEAAEGRILPDEALVQRIVAFGRGWDASAPMLIHCWAGISRSTATAFVLACERNPGAAEGDIAQAMREASRFAYPNRRIVALADDMLGRGGRMVDAVEAMGPAPLVEENRPFDLKAVWP
jgi:predicted protein tyrosine phosphatase